MSVVGKYCITIEKTERIAIWFDANGHEDAAITAEKIFDGKDKLNFSAGDTEHDYAVVCLDDDTDVVPWHR